tara:strand:- start:39 stop:239 length:201 start_codon:yes stop_codon:yes gene_type:complete
MEWTFRFERWDCNAMRGESHTEILSFCVNSNDFEEAKNEAQKKLDEENSCATVKWEMTSAEVVFES